MRLSGKITDTKIEYSHLHSTSSLLPHWDTIHATGSTLIASPLRSQQPARFSAASSSSSSNVLVTNYKPPRLTDKQSDTQVHLTLVALEHASARLDFGQMTSITSEHTDLSVHWNSTVLRSQLTRTPEIGTILQFLASIKTLYDPSRGDAAAAGHANATGAAHTDGGRARCVQRSVPDAAVVLHAVGATEAGRV